MDQFEARAVEAFIGMRPMQERAYEKRGEQFLLIKSSPASGKSRALMFIALDKLEHQYLKQAIIVVPEPARRHRIQAQLFLRRCLETSIYRAIA